MKKKIGLFINSIYVSGNLNHFLELYDDSNNYSITLLLINKNKVKNNVLSNKKFLFINHFFNRLLPITFLKLINEIEKYILIKTNKLSKSFFNKKNLQDKFEIINLYPEFDKYRNVFKFNESDLKLIKKINLNLLIQFGPTNFEGDILNICANGIISLSTSENNRIFNGPAGFWEVYFRNPRTNFTITKANKKNNGGDIIYNGYIETSFIYSLNLARLYEISNHFLHNRIEDIISGNYQSLISNESLYQNPHFRIPNLLQLFFYLIKTFILLIKKFCQTISGKSYRWAIAYQFVPNWESVMLSQSKKVKNPKNRFLADPFVIKKNNQFFCFVEDYDFLTKKGSISAYKLTPNNYENLGYVLKEDFHLSFPFIFEFENQIYMCPETHEINEIRIYKCIDFPGKWIFHKTLIKNVSAADTMIFKSNGKWWLLTNIDQSRFNCHGNQLHIFHSIHLL